MSNDRYWERQKEVLTNFERMTEQWLEGEFSYDEVLEELEKLEEDEEVDVRTYNECQKFWNRAQADESYWKDEEYEKWNQLNKDQ